MSTTDEIEAAIERLPASERDAFESRLLARRCGLGTLTEEEHTAVRLRLAETALQNAVRLQPKAGETHLASAFLRYCQLDYDGARTELVSAQRSLPNEPLVFELRGYMDRRQGRWEKSERNLRRALEFLVRRQRSTRSNSHRS